MYTFATIQLKFTFNLFICRYYVHLGENNFTEADLQISAMNFSAIHLRK